MSSVSATSSSTGIWQGIQTGVKAIKDDVSEAGDAVVSALSSVEDSVESGISSIGDAISGGVTAVKDEWATLGKSVDTYS